MGTTIGLSGKTADGMVIGLGDYGGFPPSNVVVLELLLHANPRLVTVPNPSCCGDANEHGPLPFGIEADAAPGREAALRFLDQLNLDERSAELLATSRAALFSSKGMSVVSYMVDSSNQGLPRDHRCRSRALCRA